MQLPSSLRNSQSIEIQALAISLPEYEDSVVDDYPQYLFDIRDSMHFQLDNRYISSIVFILYVILHYYYTCKRHIYPDLSEAN